MRHTETASVEASASDRSDKRKQAPLLIGLPSREEQRSLPRHHRSNIHDERCIDTIEYVRGVSKGPSQAAHSLYQAAHVLWWAVFILFGHCPPGFALSTRVRARPAQRSLLSLSFSSFLSLAPQNHRQRRNASTTHRLHPTRHHQVSIPPLRECNYVDCLHTRVTPSRPSRRKTLRAPQRGQDVLQRHQDGGRDHYHRASRGASGKYTCRVTINHIIVAETCTACCSRRV